MLRLCRTKDLLSTRFRRLNDVLVRQADTFEVWTVVCLVADAVAVHADAGNCYTMLGRDKPVVT